MQTRRRADVGNPRVTEGRICEAARKRCGLCMQTRANGVFRGFRAHARLRVSEWDIAKVNICSTRCPHEHFDASGDRTYGEAHSLVMEHEPELKAAYWNEIVAPVGLNSAAEARGMSSHEAGVEVAERVVVYFSEHGEAPYQTAMKFVLDADPALKAAYNQTES